MHFRCGKQAKIGRRVQVQQKKIVCQTSRARGKLRVPVW